MKTIDNLPPDSIDPIETCFPLESDGFDRETGKRSTITDRLHFALMDFAVPDELRPNFGSLKSHSDAFDAAYSVCELIIEASRREDLQNASVFFDEDEPALYFYRNDGR